MLRKFGVLFGASLFAFVAPFAVSADKNDKPAAEPKTPVSGEYTSIGDVTGVLAKADSSSVTLRVTELGAQKSGAQAANRRGGRAGGLKEVNHDYDYQLTADAKVRLMKLPAKTDEKGHKIAYSFDEIVKLKGKSNLPGYEAEVGDLKPGMIVRLHLVKLKGAAKDAQAKPLVNRVYIEGEGQAPADKKSGDKKPEKKQ